MVGKLYLGKAFTKKVFPSELDKNLSQEWQNTLSKKQKR